QPHESDDDEGSDSRAAAGRRAARPCPDAQWREGVQRAAAGREPEAARRRVGRLRGDYGALDPRSRSDRHRFAMNRREFLAASSPAWFTVRLKADTTDVDAQSANPPWYATMRRCGQLNLNERDPLTLNVAEWIDYWASLKLDALLLNGGGIVAFYPTA